MSHEIRRAGIHDLDALREMIGRVVESMLARGIAQWDQTYPAAALASDVEKNELHVVEMEGCVAGMIVLNEVQPAEYADAAWTLFGRVLVVHRLAIDPGRQGRKLATKLMDFAESEAARGEYDVIRLDTFTGNPLAIALYEGRGYRKTGMVSFRNRTFFCYEKETARKSGE